MKKIKTLEIKDKSFLKKPYVRYIQVGGIGEKIFEEYCRKNKTEFTKPLFLIWAVYFNYLKEKYGKLTKTNLNKFKKWNCGKILPLLTEEQINFLTEKFIKKSKSNFEITGLPDYVLLKKGKIEFVEIKTKSGFLSKVQIEIFNELRKHFRVGVCYINFNMQVKGLELYNIKLDIKYKPSKYEKYIVDNKGYIIKK